MSKEAAGIESKLEVLRQLQEQGEGFDEGTQAVLRGLDNPEFFKPAINGALADQIQVEPRFIPAIEATLGARLAGNHFQGHRRRRGGALKELSHRRLGKATIVPQDWISERL